MADLPPLREVIALYGLNASKALGQNFLLDGQLLARIARIPGALEGENVYEVGPGPGGTLGHALAVFTCQRRVTAEIRGSPVAQFAYKSRRGAARSLVARPRTGRP